MKEKIINELKKLGINSYKEAFEFTTTIQKDNSKTRRIYELVEKYQSLESCHYEEKEPASEIKSKKWFSCRISAGDNTLTMLYMLPLWIIVILVGVYFVNDKQDRNEYIKENLHCDNGYWANITFGRDEYLGTDENYARKLAGGSVIYTKYSCFLDGEYMGDSEEDSLLN